MSPRAVTDRPTQSEEIAELASQLRLAIARLNRRIRQQAAATGEELTASSQAALATIERRGPITLGELAAVEQVQPPSMTRIVARLDEWGYVTRVVDPADRRIARVAITDAGRELLDRSRTRKEAFLAQRIGGLSAAERTALSRALPILERLQEPDQEPGQ
jgi:DNA-binding MarR family transcriptional regulator